jgi:hypothetical protein
MVHMLQVVVGVSILCLPIVLLVFVFRGRGRGLLRQLESAPAASPEVVAMTIAYLRRRTQWLRFCLTVVALLIVVVPCCWMLIVRPNPKILLLPLADAALLIIAVMPFFWWRVSRGATTTLKRLKDIEVAPTLAEQFAALGELRHDHTMERDLWLLFDQKRAPLNGSAGCVGCDLASDSDELDGNYGRIMP